MKIRKSALSLPAAQEEGANGNEEEEGEVRRDVEPSDSPVRAATPAAANPETSSGYDTVGGHIPSPPALTSLVNAAPAQAWGFGVGTITFHFPASPASGEAVNSPVHAQATPSSSPHTLSIAPTTGDNTDAKVEVGTHQEQPPAGGDERSESVPQGRGGGKGFIGVLPKDMELHDIGSALKPQEFKDRPSASQALDYTSRVLDLFQVDDSLQAIDGKELLDSLTRLTTKVCLSFFSSHLCAFANSTSFFG